MPTIDVPAPLKRHAEARVRTALADTRIVAIVGPRQSGKTTFANLIGGKARPFFTLDDAGTRAFALNDPEGFVRGLATIDEIQRAPKLVLAIKKSGFVFSELEKAVALADNSIEITHYRDKDTVEVDFILERSPGEVVGVEVKASATARRDDFRGLMRVRDSLGSKFRLGVLLHDGEQGVRAVSLLPGFVVAGHIMSSAIRGARRIPQVDRGERPPPRPRRAGNAHGRHRPPAAVPGERCRRQHESRARASARVRA